MAKYKKSSLFQFYTTGLLICTMCACSSSEKNSAANNSNNLDASSKTGALTNNLINPLVNNGNSKNNESINNESLDEDSRIVHEYQEQNHRQFIDWPVDSARMTRGYLPFKKRPHLGIDLAAPKGTSILAAHDGVVVYAGRDFRGFGKMVLIEGAYGWASVYAHFTKIKVKTGERVQQGQVLGGMGRTGRATGVHLHFELRKKKGPVDPLLYLPAAQAIFQKQAKTNRSASDYSNN